jgi:hypothetical protein
MQPIPVPPGYIFTCITGKYYKLYRLQATQAMAKSICSQENATLAIFRGPPGSSLYGWTQQAFSLASPIGYAWIDGTDGQTEGTWVFADGENFTYIQHRDQLFHSASSSLDFAIATNVREVSQEYFLSCIPQNLLLNFLLVS